MRVFAVILLIPLALIGWRWVERQASGGDDGVQRALQVAAAAGHPTDVRRMLDQGGRADQHDEMGVTPLMNAAHAGSTDCVRVLLEAGASPATADGRGWTALTYAAAGDQGDMIRMLAAAGADVNAATPGDRRTALMVAAGLGHTSAVRALLAAGADPGACDSEGLTARGYAIRAPETRVIRYLLSPRAPRMVRGATGGAE